MASKPPKPGRGRKAKPRRSGAASARRHPRAPVAKATRAAATRARKTAAKATARKKAGGKSASRAGRPATKRASKAPSRKTATARRHPRTTARAKAAAKKPPRAASADRRAKVPIGLLRERRTLREAPPHDDRRDEETRYSGAARTGQDELLEKLLEHTETGPVMTGGDLDGDWEHAYSSGDEAPGGDNPTPDQGLVDDNAKALGIHYDDNEQLRLGDKEAERDRHRWELDPASAEDYPTRGED